MSFEDKEESGWQLHPLNGDTGQTYMGIKGQQKLFFKRNMTPFTAALSTEHIAPRLVWTKRLSNGDILTAQEWSEGRNLKREEMQSSRVIKILQHVHSSKRLLHILEQVGGKKYMPAELLNQWMEGLPAELWQEHIIKETYEQLALKQPTIPESEVSVCHGDLNHRNWLLADDNNLYLVDWDNALITDPLYDVGSLFSQYIAKDKRKDWLRKYGLEPTEQVLERCYWYAKFSFLRRSKRYTLAGETDKLQICLNKLKAY